MSVESPERPAVVAPPQDAPDAGVIKDARARQRRHRVAGVALLVAILAGALAVGLAGNTMRPRSIPTAHASLPTWVRGSPLTDAADLRLVVSENGGTVFVVDVSRHRARASPGLVFPRLAPPAVALTSAPGGALAVVSPNPCEPCSQRQIESEFLIAANGAERPVGKVALTQHQYATSQFDSTSTWVLTWSHRGGCMLRLVPGTRPAVAVPCGVPGSDTATGLWLSHLDRWSDVLPDQEILINPRTGRVRARLSVRGQFDPLPGDLALTSTSPNWPTDGSSPTGLTLIDLTTGSRRHLAWPSILHFGYRVLVEPHGSLVAVEFADPAYSVAQASDVWLLNTHTGRFTHVPRFPILEYLKFSDIEWTNDHRLVVVAQGGGRTAIGVWRPGSDKLQVGTVPQLAGYSQFVPLVR